MMAEEIKQFRVDSKLPKWPTIPPSTGTSIMACEFQGGVVVGADSRETYGEYVSNRVTDKLTKITDYIYCCRSGSVADTQAIAELAAYHLNFQRIETGEMPLVKMAACITRELCYNYRNSLNTCLLVAGWDNKKGGQVYAVPLGGMLQRQHVSLCGTGTNYVYGYVDANFKPQMTRQRATQFIINALTLAMERDGHSGGIICLGVITEEGVERSVITGDKLPKFFAD